MQLWIFLISSNLKTHFSLNFRLRSHVLQAWRGCGYSKVGAQNCQGNAANMSEKNCMVKKRNIRVKWYKIIFSCRHPLGMSALPEGDGELNRALLMEFKWPLFLVFKINKGKNEGFSRQWTAGGPPESSNGIDQHLRKTHLQGNRNNIQYPVVMPRAEEKNRKVS